MHLVVVIVMTFILSLSTLLTCKSKTTTLLVKCLSSNNRVKTKRSQPGQEPDCQYHYRAHIEQQHARLYARLYVLSKMSNSVNAVSFNDRLISTGSPVISLIFLICFYCSC